MDLFAVLFAGTILYLGFSFIGFIIFSFLALLIMLDFYENRELMKKWVAMAQELGCVHHPTKSLSGSEAIGPMIGRHGEFPVRIHSFTRGSGSDDGKRTAVETYFHEPLGMGLDVRPEDTLSPVGKMFGVKDIQVGDQRFDNLFWVGGDDGRAVLEFLTPEVRREVLELRKLGTLLVINDHCVSQDYSGLLTDASKVRAVLAGQAALARAMSRVQNDRGITREAEFEVVESPAFEFQET